MCLEWKRSVEQLCGTIVKCLKAKTGQGKNLKGLMLTALQSTVIFVRNRGIETLKRKNELHKWVCEFNDNSKWAC